MFAPLQGIKIVDFTHVLAGPYVTHVLCQLGAEVIKIERPGSGDVMRTGRAGESPPGFGPQFVGLNAGKHSIALDLKDPRGRDLARRLAADADVVIENLRPGELDRLGLDYDSLRAGNPGLIYCSISGWGIDGALAGRAGYDQAIQAATGVMWMQGEPDEPPTKVGFPTVDIATGMNGACAVLAALMQRQRNGGRGCRLDVAMADSAVMLMIGVASSWLVGGLAPERFGNRSLASSPTSGVFETANGWISVAANTADQGMKALDALGRPDLKDDPRFQPVGRPGGFYAAADHDAALAAFTAALRTRDADHWERAFNAAGIACARIRRIDEYLDGVYRGMPPIHQRIEDHPGYGRPVEVLGAGFRADGAVPHAGAAAEALGASTRKVLADHGLSEPEIDSLLRDGVVQAAP